MVQFGIWRFDTDFGLVGTPENQPEYYLSTNKLWETEETTEGPVWKWPLHLARNSWFTPGIADDFNKAFFYAQEYMNGNGPQDSPKSLDFDAKTVRIQAELLSDYFPGPE